MPCRHMIADCVSVGLVENTPGVASQLVPSIDSISGSASDLALLKFKKSYLA
jgi:hypothetical protein